MSTKTILTTEKLEVTYRAASDFFEVSNSSTPDTDAELPARDKFRIDTFDRILNCLTVELQKDEVLILNFMKSMTS